VPRRVSGGRNLTVIVCQRTRPGPALFMRLRPFLSSSSSTRVVPQLRSVWISNTPHPFPFLSCLRAHSHNVLLKVFYGSFMQAPRLPCIIHGLVNSLMGPRAAHLSDAAKMPRQRLLWLWESAGRCPLLRIRARDQVQASKETAYFEQL
jgi:hypothetical protein